MVDVVEVEKGRKEGSEKENKREGRKEIRKGA